MGRAIDEFQAWVSICRPPGKSQGTGDSACIRVL